MEIKKMDLRKCKNEITLFSEHKTTFSVVNVILVHYRNVLWHVRKYYLTTNFKKCPSYPPL